MWPVAAPGGSVAIPGNNSNSGLFKSKVKARMSTTRAFGIMGFSRKDLINDTAEDFNPKASIDEALWKQMQVLTRKKMEAMREQKDKEETRKKPILARTEAKVKISTKDIELLSKKPPRISTKTTVEVKVRAPKKKPGINDRSNEKQVEQAKRSYPNPYVQKNLVEQGPINNSKSNPARNKGEKYAEDVLALHEAYQFLMRRYVIAAQGREKLSHAMDTINKVNMAFGSTKKRDEQDDKEKAADEIERSDDMEDEEELPPEAEGDDVKEIPCGACQLIQKLEDVTIN